MEQQVGTAHTITITQVDPATYYPTDAVSYKCKGEWVLSINGTPFLQSDDLVSLLAHKREIVREELAEAMHAVSYSAVHHHIVGLANLKAHLRLRHGLGYTPGQVF